MPAPQNLTPHQNVHQKLLVIKILKKITNLWMEAKILSPHGLIDLEVTLHSARISIDDFNLDTL